MFPGRTLDERAAYSRARKFVSPGGCSVGYPFLVSKENVPSTRNEGKEIELDLHGQSFVVACMLVCRALLDIGCNKTDGNAAIASGLIVITGKGINSNPLKGPFLHTGIRRFFEENGGPVTTVVEGNDGRFRISQDALTKWLHSKDFMEFKKKMTA